jgi:hypothetical protein
MTSNQDRCTSKASATPRRIGPGMTAAAFSFTKHVRCSTHSVHRHCRTHHRTKEIPSALVARNPTNVLGRIQKSSSGRKRALSMLRYLAVRVVRCGNKQNLLGTVYASGVSCNFFPFDNGPICQW